MGRNWLVCRLLIRSFNNISILLLTKLTELNWELWLLQGYWQFEITSGLKNPDCQLPSWLCIIWLAHTTQHTQTHTHSMICSKKKKVKRSFDHTYLVFDLNNKKNILHKALPSWPKQMMQNLKMAKNNSYPRKLPNSISIKSLFVP